MDNPVKFSHQELVLIVERASWLYERSSSEIQFVESEAYEQVIRERLSKWKESAAQGDDRKFGQRLDWDGLDPLSIRSYLAGDTQKDNSSIPEWANTLSEIVVAAIECAASLNPEHCNVSEGWLDPTNPLPFEEFFIPVVKVARAKLIDRTGAAYQLLSENAKASLEHYLVQRLSHLCSRTLALKFAAYRASWQMNTILASASNDTTGTRQQYFSFIAFMFGGELKTFFLKYPVLARLIATITMLWVDANSEFHLNLVRDWEKIEKEFRPDGQLGCILEIETGLSDPHRGGRVVAIVTFASGTKLVYKPKNLGIDLAFSELLAWLNEHGSALPLKVPRIIDLLDHGWMEFIEPLPCVNRDEIVRYYHRSGMLLCLLYALDATDFHHENILASGEQPILVDLEMLLNPHVPLTPDAHTSVQSLINEQYWYSVLRTGLLPYWAFGPDGQAYDVSGLGSTDDQETHFQRPVWENINTDNMTLTFRASRVKPTTNIPWLLGQRSSPTDYIDEIVNGFRQMYQFLMEHKEELLHPSGPIVGFTKQVVRFIVRPTQTYFAILKTLVNPRYLKSGVDWSIQLDVLSRGYLALDESRPLLWPLLRLEHQELARFDIPYFAIQTDNTNIITAEEDVVKDCFPISSYDYVISRLRNLDSVDMNAQTEIIRGSLYSRAASVSSNEVLDKSLKFDSQEVTAVSSDYLLRKAREIADEMQRRAIRSTDNSEIAWITVSYNIDAERYQYEPMGIDLYNGSSGVALFFAALHATGGSDLRELTKQTLQPLLQRLNRSDFQERIVENMGLGGAAGLGSVIYALTQISRLLGDEIYIQSAIQLSSLISPHVIANSRNMNVIAGLGGGLLSLVALYKATSNKAILGQIVTCAERLLETRIAGSTGFRTWKSIHGQLLTGFSHGAAGISYSLIRAYEVTGEQRFLSAAQEGIAYEDSVFSAEFNNWPDYRVESASENAKYMTSWCHGASGIGLARLGCLTALDNLQIRHDIEVALETTLTHVLPLLDHLCCGNFGRIEFLLTASQLLRRSRLFEEALKRAGFILDRADHTGAFALFPNLPIGLYSPGFFQGMSGIGYELLRMVYPDKLPSVLLWET